LKSRKGFIKLALQKGVPVVPLYVFGTSDHYTTSRAWFEVRHWVMKNLRVCIPLARGLWGSACPLPVKTTIVMGEPLEFSTPASGSQPTQEEIDKAHNLFMKAVVALFDEHKEEFGCAHRQLIVC
jgi:2-acylglycerol O-acyltransferase 2